jgi:crossover junction endodeoxyribonuclease RusA
VVEDTPVIVNLPWPDRRLFPNAHSRSLWISGIVREHRQAAYLAAKAEGPITVDDLGAIPVWVKFMPPDKRRRDLDGMLSACKPYLDGIADALEVNDSWFNPVTLVRCPPTKGGEVEVEIGEA